MWKIYQSYQWEELEFAFDWIRDMGKVAQNPVFHAEGDVATHTRMVLEALHQLPEYQDLSEQDQHILSAAAILHDVEKRSTTIHEADGRITSAGHAKKGESSAREILYRDIETPFAVRETIVKLVRYHGIPIWIFEKGNPEKSLIKVSMEVNTKLLYLLALADVKGRISNDMEELLLKLDLFKEYCIELDCWDKARHFDTEQAKFHYFNNESYLNYVPFEKETFEIFMVSALPGSGKDWFIKKHFSGIPVISLDDLRRKYKAEATDTRMTGRIVQESKETAKKYLRLKQSFVWNATNLSSSMRKTLVDLFAGYGAKVRIVYIEVPCKRLIEQNRDRDYPLPLTVLNKMISKWEVPQTWEAHRVDYVVSE
jgi:predicted kinase